MVPTDLKYKKTFTLNNEKPTFAGAIFKSISMVHFCVFFCTAFVANQLAAFATSIKKLKTI